MSENQPKRMTSTDIGYLVIHLGYQVPAEHVQNIDFKYKQHINFPNKTNNAS